MKWTYYAGRWYPGEVGTLKRRVVSLEAAIFATKKTKPGHPDLPAAMVELDRLRRELSELSATHERETNV